MHRARGKARPANARIRIFLSLIGILKRKRHGKCEVSPWDNLNAKGQRLLAIRTLGHLRFKGLYDLLARIFIHEKGFCLHLVRCRQASLELLLQVIGL